MAMMKGKKRVVFSIVGMDHKEGEPGVYQVKLDKPKVTYGWSRVCWDRKTEYYSTPNADGSKPKRRKASGG